MYLADLCFFLVMNYNEYSLFTHKQIKKIAESTTKFYTCNHKPLSNYPIILAIYSSQPIPHNHPKILKR